MMDSFVQEADHGLVVILILHILVLYIDIVMDGLLSKK